MKLTCPQGHPAVVRNDPESTGQLAMCDICGWTANKVAVELDRAQRDEAKRRELQQQGHQRQLGRGQEEEETTTRRGR